MASEVKWIKLSTQMFEDEKIRLIESMPEADTLLIIWVKLLAQAGKTNASGYIYLAENIPFTVEMLSTIFNRPLTVVRLALNTFQQFGMIEITDDNYISICNWEKHQNIEGLDKIREQNRLRKQKEREKKKLLIESRDVTGQVTQNHATDIDKELDKELDKDIDNSVTDVPVNKIPYKEIVDYLNLKAGTNYRSTGKKTQSLIKARWNEKFTLDDFKTVIDKKVADANNPNNLFNEQYLRPETLFGSKFESYLNQKGGVTSAKNANAQKLADQYGLGF